MKIKFKVFVKKIKNWLSSLSKWAKSHIIPLLFLIILVLTMCFTCFSKNKKTADASSVVSDTAILYLPSVSIKSGGISYNSTPFYFACKNDILGVYLQSYDNEVHYALSSFTVNMFNYYTTGFARLKRFGINGTDSNLFANLGLYPYENIKLTVNITNYPITYDSTAINYAFYNATFLRVKVGNLAVDDVDVHSSNYRGYITYYVCYNSYVEEGYNTILELTFTDLVTFDLEYAIDMPNVQWLQPNVDLDEYALMQYNLGVTEGYNNGYHDGFGIGYDEGYYDGYFLGIDMASGFSSPFVVFSRSITELFDIPLFGNVNIGTLFYIGFGILSILIILKIIGR